MDVEAYQLSDLGNVARRRGDLGSARSLHQQGLSLKRALGDHRRIAISLEDLAALAVAEGHFQLAARWLGAASELRARIGAPLPVPERVAAEQTVAAARATMSELEWTNEFSDGQRRPLPDIVAEALGEPNEPETDPNTPVQIGCAVARY